jgi:hypothetical protein
MTDPFQGPRPTEGSRLRCLYLITAFPRCLRCPIGLLHLGLPAALSTPIGRACTGMLSPVLSLFFFYLVLWSEFFLHMRFFFLSPSVNTLYYTTLGILYALGVRMLTGFAAHGGLSVRTPWDEIEGWFLAPIVS